MDRYLRPPHPAVEAAISVLLVDDHRLMREGVRQILQRQADLKVIAETDDGHQALAVSRQRAPTVVILDLSMPGLSGMQLIRRLRQECPQTRLLVLSMHAEEQYAMRAMRAGAQGYLSKDAAAEELVHAVRKVAAGGCYLSRQMAEMVAQSLAGRDETPGHELLSDREFEIFGLIVAGKRMTEISRSLHLSVKTVSTHKTRILQKMQLDSIAGLIRYGLEHRLFPQSETSVHEHDAQEARWHGYGAEAMTSEQMRLAAF